MQSLPLTEKNERKEKRRKREREKKREKKKTGEKLSHQRIESRETHFAKK